MTVKNTNAQVCTSSSAPTPQLGAMIAPQFVNLWKHASAIDKYGQGYDTGNTLSIGDDGWSIASQTHDIRFYPGDVHPLLLPGQIIKIRFKGPATAVTSASPWQINYQNIQANTPTAGYTTLEGVIQPNFTTSGFNGLVIQFVGRVEEIQIVRPGYNFDDPRLLVDEFVTHVKTTGWKAFRMMGLSGVNGSFDQTWGKRLSKNAPINVNIWQTRFVDLGNNAWNFTKSNGMHEDLLGSATEGRQRGTSWEDQIDICNYLNIDIWINVPVLADDNYILQLSSLIKQRLKPNLNVYVEIGNEIWNAYGPTFMSGYLQKQIISWEWVNGTAEQKKIFGGTYCPGCGLNPNYGNGENYGAGNNSHIKHGNVGQLADTKNMPKFLPLIMDGEIKVEKLVQK
ncbi:MAG: hypothetical protein EAZ53_02115 [Bacteroidetes bacterium]|nr:MAG: hypothetical protein EAZ53_02115 [Bacteroidota bacterium]